MDGNVRACPDGWLGEARDPREEHCGRSSARTPAACVHLLCVALGEDMHGMQSVLMGGGRTLH